MLAVGACGATREAQKPDPSYTVLTKPGTRPPANDVERAVLAQIDKLPAGQASTVAGRNVTAGAMYTAASGRRCRTVTLQPSAATAAKSMLACKFDNRWAYVPDVVRRPAKADNRSVPK